MGAGYWGSEFESTYENSANVSQLRQEKADQQHETSLKLTTSLQQKAREFKESEAHMDENNVEAAKILYRMNVGTDFQGSDVEAAKYAIDEMGRFTHSLWQVDAGKIDWTGDALEQMGMVGYVQKMYSDETTDLEKLAFLHWAESYKAMDANNWNEVGRVLGAIIDDPSSVGGIGTLIAGGFKWGAKKLGKEGVLEGIKRGLKLSALGAVESGIYGGAYSALDQQATIGGSENAYYQKQLNHDIWRDAQSAAIAATIGTVLPHAPALSAKLWNGTGWLVDKAHTPGTLTMGVGPTSTKPKLSNLEKQVINISSDNKGLVAAGQEAVIKAKARYPENDFVPITVNSVKYNKKGQPEVTFKLIPYGFQNPPRKNMSQDKWKATLSDRLVDEVKLITQRAADGDQAALDILNQANWYRSMRSTLRQEFGGMGDVFADLLGTTSAQTDVRANWNNAVEILRRFSRGEFDTEIAAYASRIEKGESVNPVELTKLFKKGEFPLITKATGGLFNTNSPASTAALLDLFRTVKAGKSPKTINFTGNLIGYSDTATVDVWAARHMRSLTGRKAIPPVAEQGVTGSHTSKSTIEEPIVGGEFGFAQDVFAMSAKRVNEEGVITSISPEIGRMTDADLQAVAWFIEKEKWTKRGWTSKSGEGGSMDLEASFAGSAEQPRIRELRGIINQSKYSPSEKMAAQAELDNLQTRLERVTLGLSAERPDIVPTNDVHAEISQALDGVVSADESVVAYKVSNSYGRFMKEDERAIDAEFIVREDFDPTELTNSVVQMGKKYDQDAVFTSKTTTPDNPNARPGIEMYFNKKVATERVRELTDLLNEMGVDGFTFVTDARQRDKAINQVGSGYTEGNMVGVRLQYIPEFELGKAEWLALSDAQRQILINEKIDLFDDIIGLALEQGDVATANKVYYDTEVFLKGDYDDVIRGEPSQGVEAPWGGQRGSQTSSGANSSGEIGQVSGGSIHNGQRVQDAGAKEKTSVIGESK